MKRKVFFVCTVALVAIVTLKKEFCKTELEDDLVLRNVEALASDEDKNLRCYGTGDLSCQSEKVAYIIQYF